MRQHGPEDASPARDASTLGDPSRQLTVVFTREDLIAVAAHPNRGTGAILYHGMDRDKTLEAEFANLHYASEFIDYDMASACRPQLREAIVEMSHGTGALWHHQNAVFSPMVLFICKLASGILELVKRLDIRELVIVGRELDGYVPVHEAEGEVVYGLEWFPECFYPRYARQIAASLGVATTTLPSVRRRALVGLRAKLRPMLIDAGKAIFLIRRNLAVCGLRTLFPRAKRRTVPGLAADTVVFLRSHAGVDHLKNYVKWRSRNGDHQVALVVGEQMQRGGILDYVRKELPGFPVIYLPDFTSPYTILKEFLRNRLKARRDNCDETIELGYGPARFRFELRLVGYYLEKSICDTPIYQDGIEQALDALDGGVTLCVSAEMMSFYPSVEAEAALKRNMQYWNTEHDPFDKRYALRLAPGTGHALQTVSGETMARKALPWEANRLHHLGCIRHPQLEIRPSERRNALRTVVFFTQPRPSDEDHNRLIADHLAQLAGRLGFQLIVKAHPRDYFDYSSRWSPDIVRVASRLGERSEELTRASDCVVSRNSATLSEALYAGIPYISVLLDEYNRQAVQESTAEELGVRHYSLDAMEQSLTNFPRYAESYYALRAAYLDRAVRTPLAELESTLVEEA